MSQKDRIGRYLSRGHGLTHLGAEHRFGCARLAARIGELRRGDRWQRPMEIDTHMIKRGGKRYASYRMAT